MKGLDLFLVRGWIFLTPDIAWTVPRAHVIFQPVTVGHFPGITWLTHKGNLSSPSNIQNE